MQWPLISVIVTAYNSGSYLYEALQSAVNQDWPNTEILVIDDGSRSNYAESIKHCANSFSGVRLIRQDNKGLSSARNRGADLAIGEYFAFLDHDDIWRPTFLATLIELMKEPEIGASFSAIEHITESGHLLKRYSKPKTSNLTIQDFLISDPVCCGSSFLVRGSAFKAIGGFDKDLRRAETPDFFIRLISANWQIRGVNYPLVLYRNTPGSLSGGSGLIVDRKKVLKKTILAHPELKIFNLILIWWYMHANLFRITVRRIYGHIISKGR